MNKIKWYISRLNKMPIQEVFFRLKEKTLKVLEKNKFARITSENIESEVNYNKIYRLISSTDVKSNEDLKKELIKIKDTADDILNNKFDIFGEKVDFSGKVKWHRDPKTHKQWLKDKFWADIDIRSTSPYGGPKFVWELNRFYFAPILGIAYTWTGKEEYAEKLLDLLDDWFKNNPYPYGVNWTSCIELSLRIINFTWALSFMKGYELSDLQKNSIEKFLKIHAAHIYRYPSKYSSANNHALAEALALFISGIVFDRKGKTDKWFKNGKKVFEKETKRQILPDGGSAEMTTSYLSFTADMVLMYKIICDRYEIKYLDIIDERLKSTGSFIDSILDRKDNFPNIGDQDSAVLVNFGQSNKTNFKYLLNSLTGLYKKNYINIEKEKDLKTEILLGNKYKNSYSKINERKSFNKNLKYSGLYIIKDYSNREEVYWCWNYSKMGMAPLYAHGHLDPLSFYLSIEGREIFIDSGTYLYHSSDKWRRYFRSNKAHNTVRINKEDFSEQPGNFMYGKPYKSRLINKKANNKMTEIEMTVSYKGIEILRKFQYFYTKQSFTIIDKSNKKNGIFEQFFHLHPSCEVKRKGGKVIIKNGSNSVEVRFDNNLEYKLLCGSEEPTLGWYSPEFNKKEKTNTIKTEGNLGKNKEYKIEGKII